MTRQNQRLIALAAAVALAWALVAVFVVPALIEQAYRGSSPIAALNRAIDGQETHAASHYLSLWHRAALRLTIALAVLLGGAWLLRHQLRRGGAALDRLLRTPPLIGLGDLVRAGFVLGFVGGLAETLSLALRFAFNPDPREAPSIDGLWMAPLATSILGALVSLALGVVLRAWRGVAIALPYALLAGFAAFSVIRGVKLGIHPYAAMVLAAGIAVELARRSRRHDRAFTSVVRRAAPWAAAAMVLGLVATRGSLWIAERSALAAGASTAAGAPNVLLLILDTVRAEDMGLYGYERATTPEIERVAATGVTFDRALVTAPWTLPSHASMFTGLPAHELSTDFDRPLDDAPPTLASVLAGRGYATGGFVANPTYASRASGLDRGFASYRDHVVSVGELIDNAFWPRRVVEWGRGLLGRQGRLVRKTAEDVNRELLDWLPTNGRPFFAFLNYFDAHEPYEPHAPFDTLFFERSPRFWLIKGWQKERSRQELQEIRAAYDGNIAYIDHHIGQLLRALEARGLRRNTIVVITSDHGEHFGEHGGIMSHANSLYLPLLHVPLVIAWPPQVPAGRRVQSAVTLQDLPATILDLLGEGASAGAAGGRRGTLPGRSLAAHWNAADSSAAALAGPPLVSSLTYNTFSSPIDPIQKGAMQSLVQGTLHYIRNGDGSEELYDIVADPRERENLVAATPSDPRLATLRQAMDTIWRDAPRPIGAPDASRPGTPRARRAKTRRGD